MVVPIDGATNKIIHYANAVQVLTGSGGVGDPLTYSIVTSPAHGSLGGTAPNVTYTPAVNYTGTDSFTFKANDGMVDSNVATVSITTTGTAQDPIGLIQNLINYVKGCKLPKGTENSLISKLNNAIKSLENGNETAAINQINAFINEVNAQRGKKIPTAQADHLISEAQHNIDVINLP